MKDIIIQHGTTITINFEKSDGIFSLRDSITFSLEEYNLLTLTLIEIMKQTRFINWIASFNIPVIQRES